MKLIPVDYVPDKRKYHKLQDVIEEFVNGPYEVVKCQFEEGDYKSASVCACCLRIAVTRSRHNLKVFKRGDEVYLAK